MYLHTYIVVLFIWYEGILFNVYNVKSRLYFHSGVFKDKQDLIDLERQVRPPGKE